MDIKELGCWGESQAARYLSLKGYRVIERNFSCRAGEIDIIACGHGFVVFAEVKTRKNADFAQAREFVTAAKQRRIMETASLWLQRNPWDLQPRFDVIEVYAPAGVRTLFPKLNHIEDAFS